MKKIDFAISKIEKDFERRYGRARFLLYSLWECIVEKEVVQKSTIKGITYDIDNVLVVRLCCKNQSFAPKLHCMIPVVARQIKSAIKDAGAVKIIIV